MANMINCPYCGKLTDPKLESCVHCGGYLQRRAGGGGGGRGRRQTCPNCQAEVEEGAILCVACGTNLLTGQRVSDERRGGKRKRTTSGGMIAAAVGLVVVVAAIAVVLVKLSRDPVKQAREMVEAGNLLDAQDVLRDHLESSPSDEEAQYLLGKIQLRNNLNAEAARSFERAAQIDPSNTDALKLAVVSYAPLTDAGSRQAQLSDLEKLVSNSPDDAEGWYLLALARGARGDGAGQAEALQHVLELDPTNAGALREMGIALALQNKFDEADAMFSRAAQSGGGADVSAAQGFVATLQGVPDQAITDLTAAVSEQTSAQELALTQLGVLLVEQGRFAEAEKYLRQAIGVGGSAVNGAARFFHGSALRALGRPDEAVAEFDILAKGSGPYKVDAAVQEAQVFLERGNLARAREMVESVAAQASDNAAFYTTRGRVFVLNGEDQRAQEAFQQAIQVDPSYGGGYLELGLLQLKSGSFESALTNLARYLELAGPMADEPQLQQIRTLVDQLRSTVGGTAAAGLTPETQEAGQ